MELILTHKSLSDKPKCRCQGEATNVIRVDDKGQVYHEFMCVYHGTLWEVPENQMGFLMAS